jgi:hypothetical protein
MEILWRLEVRYNVNLGTKQTVSLSGVAQRLWAGQGFLRFTWDSKLHYRIQWILLLELSWTSWIQLTLSHSASFKVGFNIIFPSTIVAQLL